LLQKSRDPSAGLYGRLKYQDEIDFTATCAAHDVGLIIPRIFNLSGPYINKFDNYALASFIYQVLRNQPITIQARRPVLRSYYFIGDLIELSLQLLLNQATAGTACFDAAGEEIVELGELAERVTAVLVDHVPLATARALLVDDAVEDRYIGNRDRLRTLEDRFGMQPMPLNQQIILTSRYIKSLLQK
jgi:nucleoside-diphosphate-sugar epimerase